MPVTTSYSLLVHEIIPLYSWWLVESPQRFVLCSKGNDICTHIPEQWYRTLNTLVYDRLHPPSDVLLSLPYPGSLRQAALPTNALSSMDQVTDFEVKLEDNMASSNPVGQETC